jgi:ABC-type amino acid transport substrate-binding protein
LLRKVACLVACLASATVVRAADLPEIQRRGTLRVATWDDNLAELFAYKAGAAAGLEGEILQGFATIHKLRIEVLPVPDPLPLLLKGDGDLVAGGFVATEERRKQVDFGEELFPIRHLAVTRRPHPPVTTLAQLRAARVGTRKGTSWAAEVAAAQVPPANVDTSFADTPALMAGLKSGAVDALVMSAVWAMVEQKRDPELELGLFLGQPTSVGYAVRRDQPLLRAALDQYVANVRRTPTWSRLVVKYFGERGVEILRKSRQ